MAAWDDLCKHTSHRNPIKSVTPANHFDSNHYFTDDPEIQLADPEGQWSNYFAFLGRLVAAEVTPDWWEIPAITIKEVLAEDITPTYLTKYKTMGLAEFMNQAGDRFIDWCIESGTLDVKKNIDIMAPLMKNPIKQDWFDSREIVGRNARITRRETR